MMIVQNLYKKIFLWGYCLFFLLPACMNEVKEDEQVHIDKDLRELFLLESNYQKKLAEEGSSKALKESFQRDIELIRANFHAAVQLEGVEMHDDHEHLELDGDMLLPLNSFRGAVEMWLLEQEAQGVAREESQRQINWLNSQFLKERALYFNNSSVYWPKGSQKYVIPYRFHSSVGVNERRLTKAAMKVWEDANSTIQFIEEKQSANAVLISTPNTAEQLVLGSATVGYRPQGDGEVRVFAANINNLINKGLLFVGYDDAFKATMIHELGHTLGLLHEHQRWDSHNYVQPPQGADPSDDNYRNYAFFVIKEISWLSYQFSGETIQVPQIMEEGTEKGTCTPTDYDYASIMHYSSFTVLQNRQGYSRWEKTRFNLDLSSGDKKAIRLLYPSSGDPACGFRSALKIAN